MTLHHLPDHSNRQLDEQAQDFFQQRSVAKHLLSLAHAANQPTIDALQADKALLITALNHTQQLLAKALTGLEDFYEFAPIGYCTIDDQGLIQQANLAFANMLAVPRNALLHLPIWAHIGHSDQAEFIAYQTALQATHRTQTFALKMLKQDGSVFWAQIDIVLTTTTNDAKGYRLALTDITASRQLQTKLHLLETCISRLNDIVMITEAEPIDMPGPRIVFVNDAFVKHSGFTRDEAIGQSPRILQGVNTQRAALDSIKQAMQDWQPARTELINYTKTGEEYWLELDIVPIADDTGWYTHWIAIERDITQRKLAEIELARLNRALTVRGAMSELISHASSELDLLQQACQLVIDSGHYPLAYVAYAAKADCHTLQVMAAAGAAPHWVPPRMFGLQTFELHSECPAAQCLREAKPVVCEALNLHNAHEPMLEDSQAHGLSGVMYLPLRDHHTTLGVLAMYLNTHAALATEEIALWSAMADELAFGMMSIRTRVAEKRSQAAILKVAASVSLHAEISFFDQLTRNMAEALNADGAFIAQLDAKLPLKAMTISTIWLGEVHENFEFNVRNSPCFIY